MVAEKEHGKASETAEKMYQIWGLKIKAGVKDDR